MPCRICLVGGPGVGKSTIAARLVADLKTQMPHPPVEWVQEYVKPWAYGRVPITVVMQDEALFNQYLAERTLLDAGVSVVCDGPLWLNAFYAADYNPWKIHPIHKVVCNWGDLRCKSATALLKRSWKYQQAGRYQTEREAVDVDRKLVEFLTVTGVPYYEFDPATEYEKIYNLAQGMLLAPAENNIAC